MEGIFDEAARHLAGMIRVALNALGDLPVYLSGGACSVRPRCVGGSKRRWQAASGPRPRYPTR